MDLPVTVMDGLIKGAVVCQDLNSNNVCDSGEPTGTTDDKGLVTLKIDPAANGKYPVIALVGTDAVDADTGKVPTAYSLVAPIDKPAVVSPLTTMVVAQMAATGLSSADAAKSVQAALGVGDAFANYAAKGDANAIRSAAVSSAIVSMTQAQLAAVASLVGTKDAAGNAMTAADIQSAVQAAVSLSLPDLSAAVNTALAANGGKFDSTLIANLKIPAATLASTQGATAATVGSLVALSKGAASTSDTPEAGARLMDVRYGDANNWSFRVHLSTKDENTPDANGATRYRELRRQDVAGTLTDWAGNADPARAGDLHWNGTTWVGCTPTTVSTTSKADAAGRVTYNWCDGYEIGTSRRLVTDISGKTFQDVINQIQATPGQSTFGNKPDWFSGTPNTSFVMTSTFPAGSNLRYQQNVVSSTAIGYNVLPSGGRVNVYPDTVAAGGDGTAAVPAACSVPANQVASPAVTLEKMVSVNAGQPCVMAQGSLSNPDKTTVKSLTPNEWWGNSTVGIGTLGTAAYGVTPYTSYYSTNALLRVAFGAGNATTYYSCMPRASDGSPRNCTKLGTGTYAISTLGDARVLTMTGQPDGLNYERVFVERGGYVFHGWKNKLVSVENRRINLTALNALFTAAGMPTITP